MDATVADGPVEMFGVMAQTEGPFDAARCPACGGDGSCGWREAKAKCDEAARGVDWVVLPPNIVKLRITLIAACRPMFLDYDRDVRLINVSPMSDAQARAVVEKYGRPK